MTQSTLPFNKLGLSKLNVRKTYSQSGIDRLAANMLAHGVLQPLRVKRCAKAGRFEVTAGGRRYRAIALNIKRGHFDKNYSVPVIVADGSDEIMREQSLAENVLIEGMTPADECGAYLDIMAGGSDVDAVAKRFGTTSRYVQSRLRLAKLASPIFKALASGKISLEIAAAYGSTPDQAKQMQVWKLLSSGHQASNYNAIKRAVTDNAIDASNPIAQFVGLEAYLAAGGRTERELFLVDEQTAWIDADLAQSLAETKIAAQAERMVAERGLAWVRPLLTNSPGYDATQHLHAYYLERALLTDEETQRVQTLDAQIATLSEFIERSEAEAPDIQLQMTERDALEDARSALHMKEKQIADDMKPYVGGFLILTRDGTTELYHQLYTTKMRARPKASKSSEDASASVAAPELARRVTQALAVHRRDVLALHVANDPALALDLALFQLAVPLAQTYRQYDTGSTIAINARDDPAGSRDLPQTPARSQLDALRETLDNGWAGEPTASAAFSAFRLIDEAAKAAWLGYSVAQSLKASLGGRGQADFGNRFHDWLGAELGIDTAQFWRPTAENYFDGLRKHAILETIAEFGDPVIAGRYAAAKKSELAMAAEKLCAGSVIVEPAVKARALGWVPTEMRFVSPVQMTQDARDEQAEVEPSEANIDDVGVSEGSFEPAEIETALA